MRSLAVAALAAGLTGCALQPAACAFAQAAAPFPEVPVAPSPRRSYGWAVVSLATGAGLIGASFTLADAANARYDDYLRATDPGQIERLYDDAVFRDRLSTTSLVAGEVLVAAGLYLAFLRRPESSRLDLVLEPSRCGLSLRF